MNAITPTGNESEIVAAVFEFHGLSIPFVVIDGEVLIRVRDLGRALEYSGDGDGLRKTIRSSWGRKLREGVELRLMTGEQARKVEAALSTSDSRPNVTRFGGRTLMVTDSGMYMILGMSRQEKATEFQRWVTGTVIPNIAKTGRHEEPSLIAMNKEPAQIASADLDPRATHLMAVAQFGQRCGVLTPEDLRHLILESARMVTPEAVIEAVALPMSDGRYTPRQIAPEVGVSATSVGKAITRIEDRGVEMRGRGLHEYGFSYREERAGSKTQEWTHGFNREGARLILEELNAHIPKSAALRRDIPDGIDVEAKLDRMYPATAHA